MVHRTLILARLSIRSAGDSHALTPELEMRLKKCATLPTISAVAMEVLERCQDERLDFNEMGRIIERDPALAVNVLKMANSPLS